ncbi:MAG TPA: methyltransferase domain-containing protein, partial [Pseudonocardiaceae bacterium]|nr:methyltransferase domain-containing protein [Pseudonocardiaceae bacterium]
MDISLGCGDDSYGGWIGLDLGGPPSVYPVDLREPLPLPTRSADGVIAEHVLEHFSPEQITALLMECHRILKPGGRIRVSCPDGQLINALLTPLNRQSALAGGRG